MATAPLADNAVQSKAILGKLAPQPVKFDMASGRVRFFGPTTNMHILSRTVSDPSKTPESFWPISTLVRDLTPDTHDYLIDLFFDCHNSALHIVHKWAFFDDLKTGGTQFYSSFLHMTMLAEGYRYADRSRADSKKLACPTSGLDSSVFHMKAKKMAELELLKPGGVPSIQAFFLLGDLEVGAGRDDTGWMFAGMSFRLLFDVGLHVDPLELRLTEREVQIRHMVLWACIMNDVYWALYLGRPTMLKPSDIAPACLTKDFDRLIESQTRTYAYEKTIETKVYEALLQLMDLLEPLCETRDLRRNVNASDAYLKIATLDRTLNDWYNELPERLKWQEDNIRHAPSTFYLLHTQYHTALILLHRTFPTDSSPAAFNRHSGSTHFSILSRNVCATNAVQVAEIISRYRKRFPIQRIFVTGVQHIGTAATALMAEISMLQTSSEEYAERDRAERARLLGHLSELRDVMQEISDMYQPAKLMANVVGCFIRDSGDNASRTSGAMNRTQTAQPATGSSEKRPIVVPSTVPGTRSNTLAPPDFGTSTINMASSSMSQSLAIPNLLSSDLASSSTAIPTHLQPHGSTTRGTSTPLQGGTITPIHGFGSNSAGGLPFLPNSWFEEMNWEDDTEFLNLMGLRDLQNAGLVSGGGIGEFEVGGLEDLEGS